jgi:pimeloyl-ACP methyl ester carboxylesterase
VARFRADAGYGRPCPGFGSARLTVSQAFFGEGETPDALAALGAPVSLVYGARDEYLSVDLARHLAGLFGHAELHVIEDASHWLQDDQPEAVARILREAG